ncbi:hypothetical protein RM53_15450, partial [Brevundimonas nasdae]
MLQNKSVGSLAAGFAGSGCFEQEGLRLLLGDTGAGLGGIHGGLRSDSGGVACGLEVIDGLVLP